MTTPADKFLARLEAVQPTSNGWLARCPAHDDTNASLSLATGEDGRLLVHCHAGCTTADILKSLGLKPIDLFAPRGASPNGKPRMLKTYDYVDAAGVLLFQVCRFPPKKFVQRRPVPGEPGCWIWGLAAGEYVRKQDGNWTRVNPKTPPPPPAERRHFQETERVLYRLPQVLNAVASGETVYVVEGEKDTDAMHTHGLVATCNPGGAGKWQASFTKALAGANVVILPDKDDPGRAHGGLVAGKLHGKATSIRVLELPDQNGKPVKDAADWFEAGGTAEELVALADAAPIWAQTTTDTPPGAPQTITTARDVRGAIVGILTGDHDQRTKRELVAAVVLAALRERGRFYYHAERRDFDSAMFFDSERCRLERVQSDAFAAWLSEWTALNRADRLFSFVVAAVETAALGRDATPILPQSYWHATPDAVFLSNGDGKVARITEQDVALVDNGTDGVLFAAGRTLTSWTLTEPADPFSCCALFSGMETTAQHSKDLIRLWLLSLPTAPRSKPPLCLVGDVGSGKTRLVQGVAELYGIPFTAARVEEKTEENFWPAMDAGGLYCLDNADTRTRWLADAVATAATNGCTVRRRLYTNSETVTLRPNAWLALTTCNPTFASDPGLADRLLVVRMKRREGLTADSALSDEIAANRDAGLSFIVHTLAGALADSTPTPASLNQRHPDFAAFAVRLGRELGMEAEAVAALSAAESDKSRFCLENDPAGAALLAYMEQADRVSGTAADWLRRLTESDGELAEWSAKKLGKRLAALWPHVASLFKARREQDRDKFTVFTVEKPPCGTC